MRREAERMTSFTLIRVRNRGMMGSDFSLLFFFKAGVKQGHFFFPLAAHGLFLAAASRGSSPLRRTGFSRRRLLLAVASLVVQHRLWARGLQYLQHSGAVLAAHGLSCPAACPESSRTRD